MNDCTDKSKILLAAALEYARLGYRILPLHDSGFPYSGLTPSDAATDPERLAEWTEQFHDAQIGIACDGFVAVELDPAVGKDGELLPNPWPRDPARIAGLERAATITGTWQGRRRIIFRVPAGKVWRSSFGKLAEGVRVRGEGFYFVASGPDATWDVPLPPVTDLPEPPAWLVASLDAVEINQARERARRKAIADIGKIAGVSRPGGLHCDPGPIPEHLLSVPGFINDVIEYTLATAAYPQRPLAFAGALALQSLLASRKIQDAGGSRPTLYLIALAGSGTGKDRIRQVNNQVLTRAGMGDCVAGAVASGEGLEDALAQSPALLLQIDEMDCLLKEATTAKDGRHEALIARLLTLYTNVDSTFYLRVKANEPRRRIEQPALVLLGTAIPQLFYSSLSTRLITSGFLARTLVIEAGQRGSGQQVRKYPPPSHIVDVARLWRDIPFDPDPLVAETSGEAAQISDEIRLDADTRYSEAEAAGDVAGTTVWSRVWEKARRLALVYAASTNACHPVISAAAMAWARDLAVHQARMMLFQAQLYTAESEHDQQCKKALEALTTWRREHGADWMPAYAMNRKLPYEPRVRAAILGSLLEQRLIESRTEKTAGRDSVGYRLASSKKEA